MKIGYLIPEFPGQTHAFFWRELSAMEDQGAEIRIYSTRKPPASACPHSFRDAAVSRTRYLFPPDTARAAGYLAKRPGRLAGAIRYVMGLTETSLVSRLRLLALIGSAADLAASCAQEGVRHVHIHSCANAAHLGAIMRSLGGPSYSLTLHGDLPVYGTDHAAKFARAAFVSAVTRPLAEAIRGVSPGTPAPVIWMGVDTDRFRPVDPARARSATAPFDLVTVARLNHTKGHRYALEAVARLVAEGHGIRYRIAGEGPERGAIEKEIARLGLGDHVELLGTLGEDAVLALLQSADALALTSFGQGEAAPVTVMEAMACGLPVICSVIGGTPDMIEDGRDGLLVAQKNTDEIADALRRLVSDPSLAGSLGQAARGTALTKFGYQANADKLLAEIYAEIAAP